MASDLAISVRGLKKSYGDVHALKGVNLDVAFGECVAMLGPNGAGKTTTTEILEGFRERDSGTATVLGEDPQHAGLAWRNQLGIVLQTVNDLKDLKVIEAISHFAKYFDNPADIDEVIHAVGLQEKRESRVANLSGGQRRRLDVGLGIIGQPKLLFLDEPTTGFDPQARRQFWDLIEDLKAKGTTILLTTHYLDEAEHLADRVAVISAGEVVADTTPAVLRANAAKTARVKWLQGEKQIVEETSNPTATVRELLKQFDGEVPGLTISRPSLEEVYLELIHESVNENGAS